MKETIVYLDPENPISLPPDDLKQVLSVWGKVEPLLNVILGIFMK
jgi:hypothetical protein